MHMKFDATYKPSISVYRKLLDFDYQNALNAVADLMNYYENNYVEPCDCADEF